MKHKIRSNKRIFKYLALPLIIYFAGLAIFCCWMFHLHYQQPSNDAENRLTGTVKGLKLFLNTIEVNPTLKVLPAEKQKELKAYLKNIVDEFDVSSAFVAFVKNNNVILAADYSTSLSNSGDVLKECQKVLNKISHDQLVKLQDSKDEQGPHYTTFIYDISPQGVEYIAGATIYKTEASPLLYKQIVLSSLSGIFFLLLTIPILAGTIMFMMNSATELKNVNMELSRQTSLRELAKEEAAKAAKCKNSFLANMSHEFKTPLNAIMGFSKILMSNEIGPVNEKQRGVLECIHESGKQLLGLVSDILIMSKNETNEAKLELEKVSVKSELEHSINLIQNKVEQRKLHISLSVNDCDEHIYVDKTKFRQIVYNLISNAIKFTPDNGKIEVFAMKKIFLDSGSTNNVLKLSVKDSGIGISKENQSRLFQTFEQLDNSTTQELPGPGLGLMMVKHYVDLHHGTINVESEEEKGSCFTITLPYRICACISTCLN